ncbi:twitching motility protein PilI [Pseudoduganella flava]|uniref:Chemotaxis protein CheW n=1 Tax=Pseudoduganella flava TaxID=871742 RepID=A0A562PVZ1_9BURK|nr:chemotaxis protein CheW [Pseudoduganella flava]QGZ39669.1 chemotaxis protein CheW [Pseudoduganella flava]TWI48577.1 twitching motility protein PilI [Pseudoduganella flava]
MAAPDQHTTQEGERRSRLRQYQVQLLERMQAAQGGAVESGRELAVLLGARHCLLDLTQVGEIVPHQAITPVPLTLPWYLGLANVRGGLTGVVDLAGYLGDAPPPAGPEARLVTFAPGLGLPCALLAQRVLGLRRLAELRDDGVDLAAPPWCAHHYVDDAGQPWVRLDLAQLAREPRFLHVGR